MKVGPVIVGGILVAWAFYTFSSARDSGAPTEPERITKQTPAAPRPIEPKYFLSLEKWSWSLEGFGTIMVANFTIKNSATRALKDISIECELTAPSGTVLDKVNKTIYEIVPASKSKTFRQVNMGFVKDQVKSASCKITGAT